MSVPDFTGDVQPGARLVGPRPAAGLRGVGGDRDRRVRGRRRCSTRSTTRAGLLFLDRVAGPHGIHPRRTYR